MDLETHLRNAKNAMCQLYQFKTVQVVAGNEACDLDSAVSALVYSLLLHEEAKLAKRESFAVLPLLNILKAEFHLKREVTYWLKENNVPLDQLIFRDELDLQSLHKSGQLQLILVDHHTLAPTAHNLKGAVVEVIDHRPKEAGWDWPGKKVTLQKVGSCCSLVTNEVVCRQCNLLTQQVSLLLYGTIIFDTACLSASFGAAQQLDFDMIKELENRFGNVIEQEKIHQRILDARTDITGISSSQLLVRDLKVVNGVPICGLPILVHEFIDLPDVETALQNFCQERKVSTAVVMGLQVSEDGSVTREIAVFSSADPTVGQQLVEYLKESVNPALQLKPLVARDESVIPGLTVFQQGNIQATRKQILPIVKAASLSIKKLGKMD